MTYRQIRLMMDANTLEGVIFFIWKPLFGICTIKQISSIQWQYYVKSFELLAYPQRLHNALSQEYPPLQGQVLIFTCQLS